MITVYTVNDEKVEAGPVYIEDTNTPPNPPAPDPLIPLFEEALRDIRGGMGRNGKPLKYRSAMIVLEADEDDKGGPVEVYTTDMSRDRALVMIGKAGDKIHTHDPRPVEQKAQRSYSEATPGLSVKCSIAVGDGFYTP